MIETALGAFAAALIIFGLALLGRSVVQSGAVVEQWGDANPIVVTLARPFRALAVAYLGDMVETTSSALDRAGRPNGKQGGPEFVAIAILYAVGLAAAVLIFGALRLSFDAVTLMVLTIVIVIATVSMQISFLRNAADERARLINNSFPYFLDMMVLSLRAGANTPEAIDLFIRNNPGDPLTDELKLTRDETHAGKRFEDALPGLANRLGDKDLRTVVFNIRHGMQMGTGLSEVLRMQSADIRFFRAQNVERAIEQMRVKIQLPLVLMLIAAMVPIMGPAIITAADSGMF